MLMIGKQLSPQQRVMKGIADILGNKSYDGIGGVLMIGTHDVVVSGTKGVTTACTNGKNAWYADEFIDKLSDAELRFLILHEMFHVMDKHLTTYRELYDIDARRANRACDFNINLRLTDYDKLVGGNGWIKMPEGGCLDEKYRGMNSREVFDALMRNPPPQGGSGQGEGHGGLDEHGWEEAKDMTEKEAEGLLKASTDTELGMSHGSFVLARDPNDPRIITKYRTFEVSDLPLTNAANPFTTLSTITKEVDMDKLQYLSAILGEEKAKAFLEKTGMKQKELVEEGIEHKEIVETPAPETTDTPPQIETPAPVIDKQAIVADVLKELRIDDLNAFIVEAKEAIEKVPVLEALVKDLSAKQEDKLAEMITPPAANFLAWQKSRASQDEKTEVKDGEEIKAAVPSLGWLNELTNTTPLK